jgi:hypothetical protein
MRLDGPPTRRFTLAVCLVAACGLALQVLLSRLFAAAMHYHFSYLVISVGLLGTGAGGLVVYVRPRWFRGSSLEVVLARWSALLALSLGLVPLVFVRLTLDSARFDTGFTLNLAAACVIAAVPSLAAGITLALAIRHPAGVAFAWGVNGVASVLGSVLAVALSIGAGFRVASLVAAFCYGLALVQAVRGAWSAEPEPADAERALAPVG